MELSTLQLMWSKLETSGEQGHSAIEETDIIAGIKGRSNVVYAQISRAMKRKAWGSIAFCVVTATAASHLFITGVNDSFLRNVLGAYPLGFLLGSISLLMLYVAGLNWRGFLLIGEYRRKSFSLSTAISNSIGVLEKIQRIEVWSDTIGVPVIGFILISGWLYNASEWQWDYRVPALAMLTIVVGIWGYYMARRVNNRYQPFIEELRTQEAELCA